MIAEGRGCKMPCESCAVQFSVFKRKRICCECERFYCSGCLRRGGGAMCAPCRVLSTRPLYRNTIANLKVRDLQCFLQRQNVSTRGCVEKDELVNLCVSHVNGTTYRRRGTRANGAFSSLKGLTNNINDFLNNAFDLRPPNPAPPAPHAHTRNCFNPGHEHRAPGAASAAGPAAQPSPHRFTTTPGGEQDISVPVPAAGIESSTPSSEGARVDTADCFEIEDLDDSGWEFVARPPADPLPNDSDVLLSTTEAPAGPPPAPADTRPPPSTAAPRPPDPGADTPPTPPPRPSFSRDYLTPEGGRSAGRARAASQLELRAAAEAGADSGSLKDEPLDRARSNPATPKHVTLEEMQSPSELEALNVKQLKELLSRNRVEYRGCLERADLLQRARMLWRDHATYRDEVDRLPIEECCKICMAAPLECVLLECGHIAACTACSKQLAECPICRQYVVRAVRFFRS